MPYYVGADSFLSAQDAANYAASIYKGATPQQTANNIAAAIGAGQLNATAASLIPLATGGVQPNAVQYVAPANQIQGSANFNQVTTAAPNAVAAAVGPTPAQIQQATDLAVKNGESNINNALASVMAGTAGTYGQNAINTTPATHAAGAGSANAPKFTLTAAEVALTKQLIDTLGKPKTSVVGDAIMISYPDNQDPANPGKTLPHGTVVMINNNGVTVKSPVGGQTTLTPDLNKWESTAPDGSKFGFNGTEYNVSNKFGSISYGKKGDITSSTFKDLKVGDTVPATMIPSAQIGAKPPAGTPSASALPSKVEAKWSIGGVNIPDPGQAFQDATGGVKLPTAASVQSVAESSQSLTDYNRKTFGDAGDFISTMQTTGLSTNPATAEGAAPTGYNMNYPVVAILHGMNIPVNVGSMNWGTGTAAVLGLTSAWAATSIGASISAAQASAETSGTSLGAGGTAIGVSEQVAQQGANAASQAGGQTPAGQTPAGGQPPTTYTTPDGQIITQNTTTGLWQDANGNVVDAPPTIQAQTDTGGIGTPSAADQTWYDKLPNDVKAWLKTQGVNNVSDWLKKIGTTATGSFASIYGANAQAEGMKYAADIGYKQYLQTQEQLAPWRKAGELALGQMNALPGQVPTYKGPVDAQGNPLAAPKFPGLAAAGPVPTYKGVNRAQIAEIAKTDPALAFQMEQGIRAVEASAAAKGGYFSGQTGIELQKMGQGLATQEYNTLYNQLNTANIQQYDADLKKYGIDIQNILTTYGAQSAEYQTAISTANQLFNNGLLSQGQKFNQLASLAGVGQTAVTQGVDAGNLNAQTQAQAAIGLGQNQATLYGNIANALNTGVFSPTPTTPNYNFINTAQAPAPIPPA